MQPASSIAVSRELNFHTVLASSLRFPTPSPFPLPPSFPSRDTSTGLSCRVELTIGISNFPDRFTAVMNKISCVIYLSLPLPLSSFLSLSLSLSLMRSGDRGNRAGRV